MIRTRELPEDLDRILHDLRGPLNAIAMHLEVVKRVVQGEVPAKQSVDTVQQEVERLAAMLPAAFQVVALEAAERRPVDLRRVVERQVAEQQGRVTLAGERWPHVVGDETLLGVAVRHLVQNALEATAAAGAARPPEIGVLSADGTVTLVVRDWGPGLPSTNPKVVIRLGARRKPGHQGIGLITVERVARLHRGALTFEAPGGGAEVRLTLPRAQSAGTPR